MHQPKESHASALKHVLRYLQGSCSLGLFYKRENERGLVGYSDSSYNVDPDDSRSTMGHVFYLNECPISWCSTKQEIVALSLLVRMSSWQRQTLLSKLSGYKSY